MKVIEYNARLDTKDQTQSIDVVEKADQLLIKAFGFKHVESRVEITGDQQLYIAKITGPTVIMGSAEWVAGLLAELLHQDAVAVYLVDRDRGRLVGPKPESYGKFDLNKFKRY